MLVHEQLRIECEFEPVVLTCVVAGGGGGGGGSALLGDWIVLMCLALGAMFGKC